LLLLSELWKRTISALNIVPAVSREGKESDFALIIVKTFECSFVSKVGFNFKAVTNFRTKFLYDRLFVP
jgi:hypothetical protein